MLHRGDEVRSGEDPEAVVADGVEHQTADLVGFRSSGEGADRVNGLSGEPVACRRFCALLAMIPVFTGPGQRTEARTGEWAARNSRSRVAISATTPCLATL